MHYGNPNAYMRNIKVKVKVKWSRYRPAVAQRVGRGIALLFHDRSTRRGWVVSSTPRPHFTPGKDPVPILKEPRSVAGPFWTGAQNLAPTGIRSLHRQARSRSLYRLSYPVHTLHVHWINTEESNGLPWFGFRVGKLIGTRRRAERAIAVLYVWT